MSTAAASSQTADDFIADIIRATKSNELKLPTLPEVATKVRHAIDKDEVSADQLAKIINADPALSTRLLQVANSPMYRGARQIDNMKMAVARLGNKVIKNLVVSLIMQQLFETRYPALQKRMKVLWEHSTKVAALSFVFARNLTKLEPDQAMLAGLIHDIGSLPIINRAEHYPVVANSEALLDDAIERLHPSVGKLVLQAWSFPEELVRVAAEHEKLDRQVQSADYADVVMAANIHAYIGRKDSRFARIDWAALPAFVRLGLDAEKSIALMDEARSEIAEMQGVLN